MVGSTDGRENGSEKTPEKAGSKEEMTKIQFREEPSALEVQRHLLLDTIGYAEKLQLDQLRELTATRKHDEMILHLTQPNPRPEEAKKQEIMLSIIEQRYNKASHALRGIALALKKIRLHFHNFELLSARPKSEDTFTVLTQEAMEYHALRNQIDVGAVQLKVMEVGVEVEKAKLKAEEARLAVMKDLATLNAKRREYRTRSEQDTQKSWVAGRARGRSASPQRSPKETVSE